MEGQWVYLKDKTTHRIRATIPIFGVHRISVYLDDKFIYKKDLSSAFGEVARIDLDGDLLVFTVKGWGHLGGKLKLQINGSDAQTVDQSQIFSVGNQVQTKPSAQSTTESDVSTRSGHIFVSYRRSDSADVAGRIYDRLVGKFGKDPIFKDVDSIPLGLDFKDYLEQKVSECDALLAIIGDHWLDASDSSGKRRLEDPTDFVRIEIQSALARGIPVIPLLVRDAHMPPEASLPISLRKLVYRNGIPIRSDPDFHRDMDRLISALEKYIRQE